MIKRRVGPPWWINLRVTFILNLIRFPLINNRFTVTPFHLAHFSVFGGMDVLNFGIWAGGGWGHWFGNHRFYSFIKPPNLLRDTGRSDHASIWSILPTRRSFKWIFEFLSACATKLSFITSNLLSLTRLGFLTWSHTSLFWLCAIFDYSIAFSLLLNLDFFRLVCDEVLLILNH